LPIADAGRRHVFAGKPAALTALGFVLAAAAAVVVSAGSRVPATIVDASNADDYCTVRWVDPVDGQRRTNGVDCYEPAGRTIEIIALGGPLRGEVIDTDTPWVWAFLAGAVVLSGPSLAGWRAFRGRRHRVADAARSPMTVAGWGPAPVSVDIPVLTEAELHWSRIEEVMRRRAELEGWDAAGPLRDGVTPTRASVGRSLPQRLQVLLARGSILLPAAFGVFVALLVGWSSFAAVLATTGSSATVDATVDGEPLSLIPLITPDDLMVRFVDVDGHRVTTLVPVTGLPDKLPRTMRVEYSTAAPFRARSVDYDGRLLGTGVALLGVAVGVGITSWRVALLWRVRRREQAALLGDVVHAARYVLTQDYESNCVLVLFPGGGDVPPNGAVVLLDDLRGQIPPSGPLELRGRLEPGQAVIPVLQGEPLRTASPWLAIDQDELLDLVNAGEESAGRGF
jgi:hypothetical protein